MKLEKLSVEHFKSLPDQTFDLAGHSVNVLVGKNGKGKTSVLNAIRYLLTGALPDDPIRHGEDYLHVSGTFTEQEQNETFAIDRFAYTDKQSKCKLNSKTVTAKALRKFLDSRMNGNAKVFDLITSSEVMEAMNAKDISEYLLKVLPVTMDFQTLSQKACLTKAEEDVLKPLFPPSPVPITVDDIHSVYKEVYRQRTEITRQMAEWEKKAKFNGDVPKLSSDECQKKLDEANRLLGAASQLDAAWDSYDALLKQRSQRLDEYHTLASKFNSMSVVKPNGSILLDLQNQEKDLRDRLEAETRFNASLQQANTPLQKMLENLDSTICPLCDKIQCTTDKSEARNSICASIENNVHLLLESDAKIADLKSKIDATLYDEQKEQANADLYQKKSDLYQQINELKSSIPPEPVKPAEKQDISKLEENVHFYSEMLKSAHSYDESLSAGKQYETVKSKHDLFDSLVSKTDPKNGLLANTVISVLVNPLKDSVSKFVKSISPNMDIDFRMSDDGCGLQIFCKSPNSTEYLPMNAVSSGEKMIVLLGLMDLISDLSNAKMLSFDCIEELDIENFDSILSYLMQYGSKYDLVMIAAVEHDDIVASLSKYPVNVITL